VKTAEEQREAQRQEREQAQRKALEAQAARGAYNKQMQERFLQGKLDQQHRAEELRQQQLNQSQPYTPLYTPTLQNNSFAPLLG